jgi:hypothetical protein
VRAALAAAALSVAAVACDAGTTPSVPDPLPTHVSGGGGRGERVLVAVGDIACAPGAQVTATTCHHAGTAALLDDPAVGEDALLAVVLLGDTQYEQGRDAEYASFDATWGEAIDRARVPALPATGNHEYTDPDPAPPGCRLVDGAQHACGFARYFGDAPFTGTVADGHGSYARLFGRGTRHPLAVIVLDVGRCELDPGACAAGGPIETFLTGALADPAVNPPSACTVLAWHQARWSEYGHGDLPQLDPVWRALFVPGAARPDLVLNGHDHLYARMPPLGPEGVADDAAGIPQVIAGAGGREVLGVPFAGDPPGTTAFADTGRFGVLRVGWEPARGRLSTAFVTEDGDVADPQRLSCR